MELSKSKKQILVLYASTIIGILIGVFNSVLNTRSLSPELYGDYRYVQNIISFVSSLLLMGFFVSGSRLLAVSPNESRSRQIRGAMCVILGITILIISVVMTFFYFYSLRGNGSLSRLYLISIPVCSNALLLNYVNTTAQGDNQIGRISIARVVPSLSYLVIAYFVYKKFGATPELMLGLYNGLAVMVLLVIIISTKPTFFNIKESFKILWNENKSYGFNVYLGSLVGVSTQYVSGITLGQFCNNNIDVGFYTLALTIASPLSTLPAIIGTTYFKQFAAQSSISKKVMFGSILLTIISFVVFATFIKYVVSFLYDDSYSIVSSYSVFLAVGVSFHGLGDMINRFLGSHGQGRQIRNSAILCGSIMLIGSIVLVYYFGIKGAIITKIASSFAYFSALLVYYLKYSKDNVL